MARLSDLLFKRVEKSVAQKGKHTYLQSGNIQQRKCGRQKQKRTRTEWEEKKKDEIIETKTARLQEYKTYAPQTCSTTLKFNPKNKQNMLLRDTTHGLCDHLKIKSRDDILECYLLFQMAKTTEEKWGENETFVHLRFEHMNENKEREKMEYTVDGATSRRRSAYPRCHRLQRGVYHAWKTDLSRSPCPSPLAASTFRPIIISINNIKWLSIWNYLQHSISSAYLCMNIDIVRT